jgi:Protein of unknown function (DUF1116)
LAACSAAVEIRCGAGCTPLHRTQERTAVRCPVARTAGTLEVYVHDPDARTEAANREAVQRLFGGQPRLVDVRPAIDALPGMTRDTVLTSGPPLPWSEYTGGQRQAILGGVVYEGLAPDLAAAEKAVANGDIRVAGCHDFAAVGSLAGVTTASMPVLVVEDENSGHRGHCTLFEGETKARLNYGLYDDEVQRNLEFLAGVIGPTLGQVVRSVDGGIPL